MYLLEVMYSFKKSIFRFILTNASCNFNESI